MKKYYKRVHKLLEAWKAENNITECCVVHHRDDTPEVREYNKKHYERWGYNEDDTFEYGKYVVFMTISDHLSYHHSGDKCSMKRPEVQAKVSAALKGRESPLKGKHHTEESKQKMRIAHLGKHHTEEAKQKISNSQKGEKNWNYGKHLSEETRKKLSEAHKGKILSEEHKKKLSLAMKGFKHSDESKQKMREAQLGEKNSMYGKKHSEETCKKLSEANKGEKNGFYGKKHSEETLQHLRETCTLKTRNDALHYQKYKDNGGDLLWNAFRKLFHNNDPQVMQYLIN